MLKLIKNAEIYSPEFLGKKDLLIIGNKIGRIADEIKKPDDFYDMEVINGNGKILAPGFIDPHVHITGGGGEGGFSSRTPEIQLTDITRGGVTTVVGCLGTDSTTRTMSNLLAKARALEEDGITTYIYTGSYQFPVRTLTENIQDDIILIDKIIGVGEFAISDHRSSQPTFEEIKRVTAEARVGGILSGKAGIINVHVGDGKGKVDYLNQIAEQTEISRKQFLPTHMNRNRNLFEAGISYAKKGGIVDFTTSLPEEMIDKKGLRSSSALKESLDAGVPETNITFSSDGQGSLPAFNEKGELIGLDIGKVTSLYNELKVAIKQKGVLLETALKIITSNTADILKLENKGRISKGKDADLVLLDKDTLDVETVIAVGKIMIRDKEILFKGSFED